MFYSGFRGTLRSVKIPRGGRSRLTGHRIRGQDIVVSLTGLGYPSDDIISRCSQLVLADLLAALAYGHGRQGQMARYIQPGEDRATALHGQISLQLLQQLLSGDARADSISPR